MEALPRRDQLAKTIYDIAREAKVGIGTVSRVFNNHLSVSAETRERVLRVARKFNYHPHPYARGLARKKTNTFLAILPYVTSFFFVEILQSIQTLLNEAEADLTLHGVSHPGGSSGTLRKVLTRGRYDGLLFFSMQLPEDLVQEIMRQRIPTVLVDTFDDRFDSFNVDNVTGAKLATDHLIDEGHRSIALISANLESRPASERLKGFRSALEAHKIEFRQDLIRTSTSPVLDGFTRETGGQLMLDLLQSVKNHPTAVFATSDIQAAGVMESVREFGLKIPEDVAVIGFDDIELARHISLSTMRQPLAEMGSLATGRLFERMKDSSLPIVHRTFVPRLIVRPSTVGVRTHQLELDASMEPEKETERSSA